MNRMIFLSSWKSRSLDINNVCLSNPFHFLSFMAFIDGLKSPLFTPGVYVYTFLSVLFWFYDWCVRVCAGKINSV